MFACVHASVGDADYFVVGSAVIWGDTDADADRYIDELSLDVDRCGQQSDEIRGDTVCISVGPQTWDRKHKQELVAADAGHAVAPAGAGP